MQQVQSSQMRGFNKRHYSSPGPSILLHEKTSHQPTTSPKPPQFRRTDYTDQQNSQETSSQINQIHKHKHIYQAHNNNNKDKIQTNQDNYNNEYQYQYQQKLRYQKQRMENQVLEQLKQKERKVVELRERLKNIHHFYKVRIQEERAKNIQRSQIFVGIMEQLQLIQNQKLLTMQRNYQQMQEGQKQLGMVDQRMSSINKKVQQILAQSQQIKTQNQALQQQILQKQQSNKQKQIYLNNMKQQVQTFREQLQVYQKSKLKQNRRSKDLLQMINHHIFQ